MNFLLVLAGVILMATSVLNLKGNIMAWHTEIDDPIEAAVAGAISSTTPDVVDVGNDTVAPDGNTFRQGDRDAGPNGDIRSAQTNMVRMGIEGVGEVDGVYGRNTMNGVQDAQEMFGLPRTGVLDQATQDAFNNLTDDQIAFFTSETEAEAPAAVEETPAPAEEETTQKGLPSNIDFGFIAQQEGDKSSMYIPMENGRAMDSSGPTIGMGVDFGQKSPQELAGLPQELRTKLEPYTNIRGQEAVNFVRNNPLSLSQEERQIVNAWSKQAETSRVIALWERDSDTPWSSLTPQQATAVASVMYQYGSYRVRNPSFWNAATRGDWAVVENELRNFGDSYGARRNREANYLTGR